MSGKEQSEQQVEVRDLHVPPKDAEVMTDKHDEPNQQEDEPRDLDVPAGAAQEVKGGKVGAQDVSYARGAGKPYLSGNHNETLVRGGRLINHNETLVREGMKGQHNETVVLRDLDLPEAEAEGVKGSALGDINGESQDNGHAAQIEVVSWKLSGASDRRR